MIRLKLITLLFALSSCSNLLQRSPSSTRGNVSSTDSCTLRTLDSVKHNLNHRYLKHYDDIIQTRKIELKSPPVNAKKIDSASDELLNKVIYIRTEDLPSNLSSSQAALADSFVIINGETYLKGLVTKFNDANDFTVAFTRRIQVNSINFDDLKNVYQADIDTVIPPSNYKFNHTYLSYKDEDDGSYTIELISNTNLFPNSGEQGQHIPLARITGSSYYTESETLYMGTAHVASGVRRNDLNSLILHDLIKKSGEVKKIHTSLSSLNKQIFTTNLLDRLLKKGLITNNHTSSFDFQSMNKNQLYNVFKNCCSSMSSNELDSFIKEAIKDTPAYKIRKKFSFEDICEVEFDTNFDTINIEFVACK